MYFYTVYITNCDLLIYTIICGSDESFWNSIFLAHPNVLERLNYNVWVLQHRTIKNKKNVPIQYIEHSFTKLP